MDKVMVLDPGDSTGCLIRDRDGKFYGRTIVKDHKKLYDYMVTEKPDIVVYETFQLYPSKAMKLQWNTFYPCEVIGVIKLTTDLIKAPLIGLQPSVKGFIGTLDFKDIILTEKITEHIKDTYRLFNYWHRHFEKGSPR